MGYFASCVENVPKPCYVLACVDTVSVPPVKGGYCEQ